MRRTSWQRFDIPGRGGDLGPCREQLFYKGSLGRLERPWVRHLRAEGLSRGLKDSGEHVGVGSKSNT